MSSYHITMHRCINLTAGAVGRFENPEGMGWMRTFGGDCFSPMVGDTILPYLVYLDTLIPVWPKILVRSGTKFWWKRKTLLDVQKFWYGGEQNSGEKERHPPVCPKILVWSGTKFWWKRKPSCMSQNFGMVGNKILVKKKDPSVCPKILVRSGTKFWWRRKILLYVPKFW